MWPKSFARAGMPVQRGFVDDPRQAVRQGDEIVGQVMKGLAETFSNERATLEGRLDQTDEASTETLRIAMRAGEALCRVILPTSETGTPLSGPAIGSCHRGVEVSLVGQRPPLLTSVA
jgi:hypothetical protein